jgi:toxin YoeB
MPVRKLEFDISAVEDLKYWVQQDRKKALRIFELIQETQRDPFEGRGKPETLKHELSGCWSRRIDQEHRLVYQVTEDRIRFLACRYHY